MPSRATLHGMRRAPSSRCICSKEILLWEECGLPPLHGLKRRFRSWVSMGGLPPLRGRSSWFPVSFSVLDYLPQDDAASSFHGDDACLSRPVVEVVVTASFQDSRYFPLPSFRGGSSPNPLQVWDALDAHGTSSLQWFGFRLQCQHMICFFWWLGASTFRSTLWVLVSVFSIRGRMDP